MLLAGLVLAPLLACAATRNDSPALVPWTFHADWSGGFSGWMSFPLAQDIGYDPTLYTVKLGDTVALRHNFIAHGEPNPWFGFIRPLSFTADARTRVALRYRLDLTTALAQPEIMLVAADGHHYTAPLAAGNGDHSVSITGAQLHLAGATHIVAIILRGRLEHPPVYSESQWLLEQFELHAERTPEVALSSPKLNTTVDGSHVADITLSPSGSLAIERTSSSVPATVTLYDATGTTSGSQDLPSGTAIASLPLSASAQPGLWKAEIAQGPARTSFQFLVLGPIPQHPRLLLSPARLEELRGDARYAGLRKQVHHQAETLAAKIAFNSAAGDNIALMPSGRGIGPTEPGQLKPYIELAENYADAVAYNALDYRLNGNKAALTAARKALDAMVHWPTWVPPRFQQHGLYTYYEVGVVAQRVAFGYDLIAPELSAPEKQNTADAFWKLVIHPTVEEYFSYNRDPIAASNWMANSVGGAIEAAVAVAGDTPGWREREAPALAKLQFAYQELLQGLFPGDGSESEPYGYENFAMQGMSWGMSSLNALGIHPAGAERMVRGFWWPYYVTVRQGLQLDTGDFNGHLTGLPGFAQGAGTSGIPELRALYDTGTNLDLMQGVETGHNGHLLEERLGPIDLACCSGPDPSFTPPPTSRVFPSRGSAALRSGWSDDATVISLRLGPWFNHQHADEGSFQVAAFGTTLIDEAGYANYYTDPRYPDYFTQAAGHNTLLVDGNPFSQAAIASRYWPGFATPHFTSRLLADGIDYLAADLTSAYDGALEHYEREFLFLKPGVLIVRDRVRSSTPHVFSFLLHSPADSKITTSGASAVFQAKKAAAEVTATGDNATWTVTTIPVQSTLFTDLDHQHINPRQEIVLSSEKTAATQFLAGMTFMRGAATSQSALKPLSSANSIGFAAGANEVPRVVFRTHPGALVLGPLSTDGEALALNTGGEDLALGAKEVQLDGRAFLRADEPVDIVWQHATAALEIHVFAAENTTLEVSAENAPTSVTVDGKAISVRYSGKMIAVPLAGAEEHHVSIQ
jgi:hypothetical protein